MAIPQPGACASGGSRSAFRSFPAGRSGRGYVEGGHQLEKLEFALAIAEARGDMSRCSTLRDRIADLGGNAEEPGT